MKVKEIHRQPMTRSRRQGLLSLFPFCIVGLALSLFFIQDSRAADDWESTLKNHFDFVDTFDNDADWAPSATGYQYATKNVQAMPKRVDGSSTIWTYYTTNNPSIGNWISDHGSGYRWRNSGKSLCINYDNFLTPYDANSEHQSYQDWTPNSTVSAGKMVYPTQSNGWLYKASTAGTSGATEPAWPACVRTGQTIPLSGSVVDNGITWQCAGVAYQNWEPATNYAAGARVTPLSPKTGWFYIAQNAGTSSGLPPKWPSCGEHPPYSGSVVDGSITWSCGGITNGWGPTRLGMYLGDSKTPKSGYKVVYLFFMAKFHPGFHPFITDGGANRYAFVDTMKMFDICSGFVAPDTWGNSTDRAQTCNIAQSYQEYGINMSVFNNAGGGISYPHTLFISENTYAANDFAPTCPSGTTSTAYKFFYKAVPGHQPLNMVDFTSQYEAGKWIGIEVKADIGTSDNADGSTEVWLYDESGNVFSHFVSTAYNKLIHFDHYYNKITLGGNRLGAGYGWDEGISDENRFYVDDVIVHHDRVGPTYFGLLNNHILPPPRPWLQ